MTIAVFYSIAIITIIATFSIFGAANVAAEKDYYSWDIKSKIAVGYLHDSNVSIREIDSQLDESDSAINMEGGLTLRGRYKNAELSTSYNFSRSKYQTFSEVNRETSIFSADLSGSIGRIQPGISFHEVDAKLGDEDFLDLTRWSPYISGFISKRLYMRGAFVAQEKLVDPRPDQSSTSDTMSFNLYYFRNGLRRYFDLGLLSRKENASLDRYDNRSKTIRFRMLGRARVMERIWRYTVSWSHERREYKGIWPRSDNERFDRKRSIRLTLNWPISKSLTGEIFADLIKSNSSVSYASFEEDIAGFKITYTWNN